MRQFSINDTDIWLDKYGNGQDGAYAPSTSTDATPVTPCTGTNGTKALTITFPNGFLNGDLVLIHDTQGTGADNWELNKIGNKGTGTNWTMAYTLQNTYGIGSQVYKLFQYSSVNIAGGVTLTGAAWNGSSNGIQVVFANRNITITGNIIADALGFRGGSGTSNVNNTATQGESSTGNGTSSTAANTESGGGGHGSANVFAGSGGGGGHANAGNSGNSGGVGSGAGGNASADNALLSLALFGGSGGGPSNDSSPQGAGGNGGGLLILIAPTITVTGGITASGGNGLQTSNSYSFTGSGGSGAGGGILFMGQNITLGSSLVTALAGTPVSSTYTGGTGSVGRIAVRYGIKVTGTTNPSFSAFQDSTLAAQGSGLFFSYL